MQVLNFLFFFLLLFSLFSFIFIFCLRNNCVFACYLPWKKKHWNAHIHKIHPNMPKTSKLNAPSTNPIRTNSKSDRVTYRTVKMIFKMTDLYYVLVIKCKYNRNDAIKSGELSPNLDISSFQFKRRNAALKFKRSAFFYYPICTLFSHMHIHIV